MDAERVATLVRDNWPKPFGLILAWVALALFSAALTNLLSQQAALLVFAASGIAVTFDWLRRRLVPRCPDNKFGFVVAISVENDETYRIFQRDFIQNLERHLRGGSLGSEIWVCELPQVHLDRPLTHEQAVDLRRKTRAGFVLYGQVRTRQEASRRRHYLDLSGVVGHAETTQQNKNKLTGEFGELLPQRTIADEGAELPTFELTSSLSSLAAKYVAGIAAFLSGFLDYAVAMYVDAELLANKAAPDHEVAKKILERLPMRLAEVSVTKAKAQYDIWKESHDEADLLAMAEILNAAPDQAQQLPAWKTLRAIALIVTASDDFDSIEALVEKTPQNDPVTQMNLAFFDVLRGDFRSATRHYRTAEELGVDMGAIEEVMSFFEWFRDYRPSYGANVDFALGYIAYFLLRDASLAKESFDAFEAQRQGAFDAESKLIPKWLAELRTVSG